MFLSTHLHLGVFMALAQACVLVDVIHGVHALLQHVMAARLGLTAATDAASRTRHHLGRGARRKGGGGVENQDSRLLGGWKGAGEGE